ncbi:MAG: hypothetical protein P8K80_05200 [Phycisphaerales bacterium]|nr:hypothetical protein [Phycisphaerales bacterium]
MAPDTDMPNQDDHPVSEETARRSFFKRVTERREKAKAGFARLKEHLGQEKEETKEMLDIYHRASEGKASKEEIHRANEQFGDLLRLAGMGTFFTLVPGSALLLPLAIYGAGKVGIRLLPSAFSEDGTHDSEHATNPDDEPS